jgi:hypothetical protein
MDLFKINLDSQCSQSQSQSIDFRFSSQMDTATITNHNGNRQREESFMDVIKEEDQYIQSKHSKEQIKNRFSQDIDNIFSQAEHVESLKMQNSFLQTGSNTHNRTMDNTPNTSSTLTGALGNLSNSSYLNKVNNENKTLQKSNLNFPDNNRTKGKINMNSSAQSEMARRFQSDIRELKKATIKIFDEKKDDYCNFIEKYKTKFLNNIEVIESVLAYETDFIIKQEESKNHLSMQLDKIFQEISNFYKSFNN